MPNPKRRHSHARTRERRAHDALKTPQFYIDKDSGEAKQPHRIDPKTGLAYPAHFLSTVMVVVLTALWIGFDWVAYPGRFGIESAPVVYVYASLLLFVWLFAALNFHLGRLHISSIAVLLIFVIIGYSIFSVDHEYGVTREQSKIDLPSPVDAAKKSGPNLVVVASAGGGIWAAGWTTLALEKLIGQRSQLASERNP